MGALRRLRERLYLRGIPPVTDELIQKAVRDGAHLIRREKMIRDVMRRVQGRRPGERGR